MVQLSPRVWFCPDTVLRRLLLLLGFFLSPQPVVTEWGIIKRGVMHSWWEVEIWMSYQPKEGGKHEPHARSKPSSNHIWHVWLGGLCSDNHILIPHVSLPVTAGGVFSAFYPHSLLWEAQNVQLSVRAWHFWRGTKTLLWMFTPAKYEQHGQSHGQHLLQIIQASAERNLLKYESIFYILH